MGWGADQDDYLDRFFVCHACCVQVGAGHTYQLMPEVFTWQGLAGKFEGFGTNITPLDDDDAATS